MRKFFFVRPEILALALLLPLRPAAADPDPAAGDDDVFMSLTRSEEPRDRLPTNISVVTAAEIRAAGAQTVSEALTLLPGVNVQRTAVPGAFSTVRLRGVPSSNEVQVVVDDEPLGGVSLQNIDVGQIPVEDIDRIEVVRGGASVLYGANTIGGVIHIITKKAAQGPAKSDVGYEAGSFGTQVQTASLGKKGKQDDGWVGARRYHTDGFQNHSDGHGTTVSANAGHSFENGARLAVEGYRNELSFNDPQGTLVPLDQWDGKKELTPVNDQARFEESENRLRVRGNLPLGRAGSVQALGYAAHSYYLADDPLGPSYPFPSPEFYQTDKNIGGTDVRFLLAGGITAGVAYELDQIRVKGNPQYQAEDEALYLQWTGGLGPVDFLPAARYDHHSAFGGTLNPRFTAVLHAAPKVDLSANVARSFRAPDLLQLHQDYPSFASVHNADLQPETAWTYDAGVRLKPSSSAFVQLTGFLTRFQNLMAFSQNPFPALNMPINAPRAQTSGAELEAQGRWGSLSSHASYTYQRTVKNALDRSTRLGVALTPRHTAAWQTTWEAGAGWAVTEGLQYVDKRFETDGDNGRKLPSFTLWNMRISKRLLGAEFFLAAEDLTNKRYVESVGFDNMTFAPTWTALPGRTFKGGVTLRFND